MKVEIKSITPSVASELLAMNTSNRKLSVKTVKFLTEEMLSGNWKNNGDSIRIDKNGVLLDGQHRLNAVVKSGKTFDFVVMSGFEPEVFSTIDVGKKRSGSDALGIEGHRNTTVLSTLCRMLIQKQRNGAPFTDSKNQSDIPLHKIVDMANHDDFVHDAASFANAKKKLSKLFGNSNVAYAYYEFTKNSPSISREFFDQLESGIYSYRNSPVMALKELFVNFAIRGIKPTRQESLAYLYRAYNAFKREASVKRIKLVSDRSEWFKL